MGRLEQCTNNRCLDERWKGSEGTTNETQNNRKGNQSHSRYHRVQHRRCWTVCLDCVKQKGRFKICLQFKCVTAVKNLTIPIYFSPFCRNYCFFHIQLAKTIIFTYE